MAFFRRRRNNPQPPVKTGKADKVLKFKRAFIRVEASTAGMEYPN
jgi:hypothetical protein